MHDLLISKLQNLYNDDEINKIINGLRCYKKVTFRVNKIKSSVGEIESFLKENNINFDKNKSFYDAFILKDYSVINGKNILNEKNVNKKNNNLCEDVYKKNIEETLFNKCKESKENNFYFNNINQCVVSDNTIKKTISDNVNKLNNNEKIDAIKEWSIYKDGKIYLQSLSSMLPVFILEPKENENILDMCAAPGSKTTMIQSECLNKANVTALEVHKDRFERLKYNCELQGANVYLINQNANDLNDFLKFDKILLDAPCSGTGTLDLNNENYTKNFTEKLVEKCVGSQKKLIKKAFKILKKEGVLIYSTCSLLKEENEDIVSFAKKEGFELCDLNYKNTKFIKILPDELFEGFFIAKFIKK